MKRLILVDGNSLMFRSYYATAYSGSLMKTTTGLYTNALFGFCNMIQKLLEDDIEYAFIAFDAGKKTFRHQEYQDYKGKRAKLPDELREQIPLIKKYLDIIEVKRLESFDYEADDLIASVATEKYSDFDEIKIITGDKDLLQLVKGKIKVCLTKKGVGELDEYNEANFLEKMGFKPLQILDYKGLVGDSSDNLPGIKGVGEKTALKLINQYGSIEKIYENIDDLKGKTKDLFIEGKSSAFMCKRLATLKQDIELDLTEDDLKVGSPDEAKLKEFFKQMEFTSLIKKIEKSKTDNVISDINYILVDKEELAKEVLNDDSFLIAEIFGSNYYRGEFLGFSCVINNQNYFFKKNFIKESFVVKEFFENDKFLKRTFDYKSFYVSLKQMGITLKGVDFDLLLASYLINPTYANDDFKRVIDNFKVNNLQYLENVYGANSKANIPSEDIYIPYSIHKAILLKDVYEEALNDIKERDCKYLFDVEMNLATELADMEILGLKVDLKRLKEIGIDFSKKAEEISKRIFEISEGEFNLNSPKQLGEVLFDKLKLPHGKKNKTGFSTSVEVLEKLAPSHEIADLILKYRGYMKIVSTYVNGIFELADVNSFIHPLYKQALTLTGRLSSVEPNIQNMPIRTETAQVIREIFTSRFDNGRIISADYSQIELRVLAHMSNDENMIKAFNESVDFHSQTASQLYDVEIENVTKDQRRTAKAINFGIIYGMSAWGLSETLNISPLEANIYINKYFYTYAQAKTCLDNFIIDAKEKGYTTTLYNRRRYIEELSSDNANLRGFGERTAMNSPIQGTAADIIKIAMDKVSKALKEKGFKTLIIAQVHDELLFDAPFDEVDKVKLLIKETMENAVSLKVPLVVDANSGINWFSAK